MVIKSFLYCIDKEWGKKKEGKKYKNMDKVQNGRPENVYLKSVWLK